MPFLSCSETTQCIILSSRQGTTDTIEEVEDEQEPVAVAEETPWGPAEHGTEEAQGLWWSREVEVEVDHQGPEPGETAAELPQDNCMDDAKEGEAEPCTPDTDAPTDAEVPPSYSKAVSFERISVSLDEDGEKRLMAMTPDTSRSDCLDDITLPSLSHELTASELLLHK